MDEAAKYRRGGEIMNRLTTAFGQEPKEPNMRYPVGHVPRGPMLDIAIEEMSRVSHDSSLTKETRHEIMRWILYLVYRNAYGTGQNHFTEFRHRFVDARKPRRASGRVVRVGPVKEK